MEDHQLADTQCPDAQTHRLEIRSPVSSGRLLRRGSSGILLVHQCAAGHLHCFPHTEDCLRRPEWETISGLRHDCAWCSDICCNARRQCQRHTVELQRASGSASARFDQPIQHAGRLWLRPGLFRCRRLRARYSSLAVSSLLKREGEKHLPCSRRPIGLGFAFHPATVPSPNKGHIFRYRVWLPERFNLDLGHRSIPIIHTGQESPVRPEYNRHGYWVQYAWHLLSASDTDIGNP